MLQGIIARKGTERVKTQKAVECQREKRREEKKNQLCEKIEEKEEGDNNRQRWIY